MHVQTSSQERLRLGFGDYTCNWGLHMAGLYETPEERDAILFGFLRQGFRDGDLQFYCPTERTRENFLDQFSTFCPECAPRLDDQDAIQLSTTRELYYPDGFFSPWAMDRALTEFFEVSQENGRRNIRASAEMTWALDDVPGAENLMAYESRLNYFIPGKPWISICLYNLTRFSGAQIMQVLRTHPFTVSGGVISQNPYFMDPDTWLAEHAPEFLSE